MVITIVSPTLFLAAMGLGLGSLVDGQGTGDLGGVDYIAFLAPGLLAASAMQLATVGPGRCWARSSGR